jgi:16S rRNA (adenine1518-N6/adenine1519-N6)-dimethyltransferase
VERDDRCLPALEQIAAAFPGQLSVIAGDAMKLDSDALFPETPYHIVANLPYNIGTALLVRWLESPIWPPRWQSLTLMFQQEVAERIIAKSDTNAYGRLSVLAQWRCTARLAMRVHRSAFTPPPKVMSAVVHITPAAIPDGVNPRLLSHITAAAFGQRRKMLRQSLKGVAGAIAAMEVLAIEPTRRAETLAIGEFVGLARYLSANPSPTT